MLVSGGGAGNCGGLGNNIKSNSLDGSANTEYNGENGTGGLLIIYTQKLDNRGKIEANGCNGGKGKDIDHSTSGGSSGGGSINIFYKKCDEIGKIEAIGGEKIENSTRYDNSITYSGEGGKGSITIGYISEGSFIEEKYEEE